MRFICSILIDVFKARNNRISNQKLSETTQILREQYFGTFSESGAREKERCKAEKTLPTHQDIQTISRHFEARGKSSLQCPTFRLRSGQRSEIVDFRSADRSATFLLNSKFFHSKCDIQ